MQRRIEQQPGELTASACPITLQPLDKPTTLTFAKVTESMLSRAMLISSLRRLSSWLSTTVCNMRHTT